MNVFEGAVFHELCHFEPDGILPHGVVVLLVDCDGFLWGPWDLIAVLVDWCSSEGSKLGLLRSSLHILLLFAKKVSASFPTFTFE